MASPWGDSRYPQFPGRYPPNPQPTVPARPYEQRRSQYVQPAAPGFYNPAIMPPRQPPYTAPPHMPIAPSRFPPSLQPGGFHTHTPPYRSASGDISGDLFFQNPPSFPKPQIPPPVAPQLKHSISAPAPPLPKKPDFNQPPLPPKPSFTSPPSAFPSSDLYPQNVHASANVLLQEIIGAPAGQGYAGASPIEKPFIPEDRVPEPQSSDPDYSGRSRQREEEEQLKQALEQSAKYAETQKKREDEELARAMEESLKIQRPRTSSGAFPSLQISSSSLSPASAMRVAAASTSAVPETEFSIVQTASPSSYFAPAALVPASAPVGLRKTQSSYFPPVEAGPSSQAGPSSSSSGVRQIFDDEALARSLMEEEERGLRRRQDGEEQDKKRRQDEEERDKRRRQDEEQARRTKDHKQKKEITLVAVNRDDGTSGVDGLPQYSEVVTESPPPASQPSSPPAPTLPTISSLVPPDQTRRESSPIRPSPSPPAFNGPLYRSTSANAIPTTTSAIPSPDLHPGRSHSFTGGFRPPSRDSSSPSSPNTPPQRTPNGHPLPPVQESSESSSSGVMVGSSSNGTQPTNEAQTSPSAPAPSPPSMAPNQFVDPELLRGVSKSFPQTVQIIH